jgi:hypothetical protein
MIKMFYLAFKTNESDSEEQFSFGIDPFVDPHHIQMRKKLNYFSISVSAALNQMASRARPSGFQLTPVIW